MMTIRPPMVHPNVSITGQIVLPLLHKDWDPTVTIERVLLAIQDLLNRPNIETGSEPICIQRVSRCGTCYMPVFNDIQHVSCVVTPSLRCNVAATLPRKLFEIRFNKLEGFLHRFDSLYGFQSVEGQLKLMSSPTDGFFMLTEENDEIVLTYKANYLKTFFVAIAIILRGMPIRFRIAYSTKGLSVFPDLNSQIHLEGNVYTLPEMYQLHTAAVLGVVPRGNDIKIRFRTIADGLNGSNGFIYWKLSNNTRETYIICNDWNTFIATKHGVFSCQPALKPKFPTSDHIKVSCFILQLSNT